MRISDLEALAGDSGQRFALNKGFALEKNVKQQTILTNDFHKRWQVKKHARQTTASSNHIDLPLRRAVTIP